MNQIKYRVTTTLLAFLLLTCGQPVQASDAEDLKLMLGEFLANVTKAETHDRFWADDLIYTSSRGTRTTKEDIMSGFKGSDNQDQAEARPSFSAQDIQIQIYDDAAIVAFRLVATPPVGAEELGVQNYFNTGTFVKRDGKWNVVAWQATIIPAD